MPIYSYCEKCYSGGPVKADKCQKCGEVYGRHRRYRIRIRRNKKTVSKIADNLTLAREIESTVSADMLRDTFDTKRSANKKPVITMDAVFEKYLPYAKQNKKSWRTDELNYRNHIQPIIGRKRLNEITPEHVDAIMTACKKSGLAAATVKHQIILTKRLFNLAERWELTGDGFRNPTKFITLPKVDNEKNVMLTDDQAERLETVLKEYPDKPTAAMFQLAMFTGLRRSEIFNLLWTDINFEFNLIRIREPKGGKTIDLSVSDKAIGFLKDIPRTSVYLFPGRDGGRRTTCRRSWAKIKKLSGIPDEFRFHDLRHNFASQLASDGTPLPMIQAMLTHKDIRTTQRYAHLLPDAMKEAVNKSADIISKVKTADVISIEDAGLPNFKN